MFQTKFLFKINQNMRNQSQPSTKFNGWVTTFKFITGIENTMQSLYNTPEYN